MNKYFRKAACVAAALAALTGVAHAAGILVRDIPLDSCTVPTVLTQLHSDALQRESSTAAPMLSNLAKVKEISKRYEGKGKPGQQLGELMSPNDAAEFATLSAQSLTIGFYTLAQSRLQRDMMVLLGMQELARKDRTVGVSLKETDPDFKVYTYLYAMRTIFAGTEHGLAANQAECSLDLAFEREATTVFKEMTAKVQASLELKELLGLRTKYGAAAGSDIDATRLSAAEAEKLPTLKAAVAAMLRGQDTFQRDNSDLRFFAEVSQMQFEWQKENILQLGATATVADYDKADAARYAALNPRLQQAVNLWHRVDESFPSQAARNAQMVVDFVKAASK